MNLFDLKSAAANMAGLLRASTQTGLPDTPENREGLDRIISLYAMEAKALGENLAQGKPSELTETDHTRISIFNQWIKDNMETLCPYVLLFKDARGALTFNGGRYAITVSRWEIGDLFTIYSLAENQQLPVARGRTIDEVFFGWMLHMIEQRFVNR